MRRRPATRSVTRATRSVTRSQSAHPVDLQLFENALSLITSAVSDISSVGRIGCTCWVMRHFALREDIWQVLLFHDFPSSAALPMAAFDHAVGRGYRWHYQQRLSRVPDTPDLPALPTATLTAADLILLVELHCAGARHLSHAVQGAEMGRFLSDATLRIPPQTPWTATSAFEVDGI